MLDGAAPENEFAWDGIWMNFWGQADHEDPPGQETMSFARRLAEGVFARLTEVDAAIQRSSHHWKLERMARVDRNVLRMAVCELLFLKDAPAEVVLNEAVELARLFGTEESSGFVNGILDRLIASRK